MYKIRIQLYIPDDHGEDIVTSIEATYPDITTSLGFVNRMKSKGKIQAVRMVEIDG